MNGSGFDRPSATARACSYILRETAISMAINMAITAGFYWLAFGGLPEVSAQSLGRDCIPQSFMIALMSAWIPSLIARKNIGKGTTSPARPKAFRVPSNLFLRALTIALPAMVLFTGLAMGMLTLIGQPAFAFATGLALKLAFGALVAACVTPLALWIALSGPRGKRTETHV